MEFVDLKYQYKLYRDEIQYEIGEVMKSASFIMGPALKNFETEMMEYLNNEVEAIGCASGTDALMIALMALELKPGDEVIVPDFTFIATGEVVSFLGAVPVFCDVDSMTYNLNPSLIENHITDKTVGVIPVSIFGQTAVFDTIHKIAEKHGLWVLEDGAQSFGATYKGRKSCTLTDISTTSFFPAKPLGCYGDAGAIFTRKKIIAEKVRTILNHGQEKRYHHSTVGVNGRMDSIQAAVLSVKLRHFDYELELRRDVAKKYSDILKDKIQTPKVLHDNESSWAQFTVQHSDRESLREDLKLKGIPTAVHYPIPLHKQEAFAYLGNTNIANPITEKLSKRVLSLPMHPFISESEIEQIAEIIKRKA